MSLVERRRQAFIDEQGRVEVGCEFCGLRYHFEPDDVGELFTPASRQMRGSNTIT